MSRLVTPSATRTTSRLSKVDRQYLRAASRRADLTSRRLNGGDQGDRIEKASVLVKGSSLRASGGEDVKTIMVGKRKRAHGPGKTLDAFLMLLQDHLAMNYVLRNFVAFGTGQQATQPVAALGNRSGSHSMVVWDAASFKTHLKAAWDIATFNNTVLAATANGETTLVTARASAFADRGAYFNHAYIHEMSCVYRITNLTNTKMQLKLYEYAPVGFTSQSLVACHTADLSMFNYRRGTTAEFTDANVAATNLDFDYRLLSSFPESTARQHWRIRKQKTLVVEAAGSVDYTISVRPGLYSFSDFFRNQTINTDPATSDNADHLYCPASRHLIVQVQGAETAFKTTSNGCVGTCEALANISGDIYVDLRVLPSARPVAHYGVLEKQALTAPVVMNDETDTFIAQVKIPIAL